MQRSTQLVGYAKTDFARKRCACTQKRALSRNQNKKSQPRLYKILKVVRISMFVWSAAGISEAVFVLRWTLTNL